MLKLTNIATQQAFFGMYTIIIICV